VKSSQTAVELAPSLRLETLPRGLPKYTLGFEAMAWAERYLRQPNGPNAGRPWEFVASQAKFLVWWYALDEDGQWLFRRACRRLSKGSGKSPFAAVQALIELCAPVRLDDFDRNAPLGGGVRGRPVDMPLVQIAATAESQTSNTMRMVRAFAAKGSPVVEAYQLDPGKTVYYKPGGGELKVITSSLTASEGAEATFIVADETEHWRPNNGGPELHSTLSDNLAKSGSRMLETCNAWVPGLESVAEATWDAWVAQEEGKTRGETRILYDARVAPPDTDLTDERSLTAALEFVYGDCWWQTRNIAAVRERIWDSQTKPDDSRRKYLNQPTAAEDAWTTPQQWAVLVDTERVVTDGEDIVLFFDGSKTEDSTALVGCCVSDGHIFAVDVWEPSDPSTPYDEVPAEAVDAAVAKAFDKWNPLAFFGDVREWESFVKVTWPAAYADRLLISAVPTGKAPEPIAWDMRSHTFEFTQACELVEAEIREATPAQRAFTHNGDARLARHVGNARRRPNRYGVSIGKESRHSPLKVDGAVCVVGAHMVRRLLVSSGKLRRQKTGQAKFL